MSPQPCLVWKEQIRVLLGIHVRIPSCFKPIKFLSKDARSLPLQRFHYSWWVANMPHYTTNGFAYMPIRFASHFLCFPLLHLLGCNFRIRKPTMLGGSGKQSGKTSNTAHYWTPKTSLKDTRSTNGQKTFGLRSLASVRQVENMFSKMVRRLTGHIEKLLVHHFPDWRNMSNPKDRSPATHRDPKEISIDLHGSIVCGGV